jgi:hypothetical protein
MSSKLIEVEVYNGVQIYKQGGFYKVAGNGADVTNLHFLKVLIDRKMVTIPKA